MGVLDVVGFVLGVLGAFGLVPPLYRWLLLSRLPSQRMKCLDTALEEVTSLLDSALAEGLLLPDAGGVARIERRMERCRKSAHQFRAQVVAATTLSAECTALWKGLSQQINNTEQDVRSLLVEVATSSQKERERLEAGSKEELHVRTVSHTELDQLHEKSEFLPMPEPHVHLAPGLYPADQVSQLASPIPRPPPAASHPRVGLFVRQGHYQDLSHSFTDYSGNSGSTISMPSPSVPVEQMVIPQIIISHEDAYGSLHDRPLVPNDGLVTDASHSLSSSNQYGSLALVLGQLRSDIVKDVIHALRASPAVVDVEAGHT